MRAYGQVLGEWCDVIAELDCAMSGAECVPEPTGTGSVCKCKESAGYQKYGPDGGERCAPSKWLYTGILTKPSKPGGSTHLMQRAREPAEIV